MTDSVYFGDCLDIMPSIPDKSIDMILCDLPYGTTACRWDSIIPFEPLWEQYRRIIKPGRAIVLTASQPFTSALVMSNPDWFKQSLVWSKGKGSNPLLANKRIMSSHEDIIIFGNGSVKYNPQMREGMPYKAPATGSATRTNRIIGQGRDRNGFKQSDNAGFRFPLSVLEYSIHCGSKVHPTQKPVALFEYLIRTYSDEGDIILDNAAGSGTTGIAALNTGRRYIMIEKDEGYFNIIKDRLSAHGG